MNIQANYGYSPGALRAHDGRLWIPTRSGLAMIDPVQSGNDMPLPPVLIQQIIMDEKTIARYSSITPNQAAMKR